MFNGMKYPASNPEQMLDLAEQLEIFISSLLPYSRMSTNFQRVKWWRKHTDFLEASLMKVYVNFEHCASADSRCICWNLTLL